MYDITLKNVPISFPYEPYDVQKKYMEKLLECLQNGQNGILESPTGTGKSLSLLCASLAWLEIKKAQHRASALSIGIQEKQQNFLCSVSSQLQAASGTMWKQGSSSCPKIIFSSRTHSQLSQAISELKKTSYCYMKTSILGSRDQMCIHPEVSKETSNMNKVHMCQLRVKGRNCYFYNQVESKKLDPEFQHSILDLEDLVKLGKKKSFCPYYMAKEIRQDADIIFLPYNYLLDPKSRKAHGIELQGNVVIFDEAHNVEKMCEESASLQLRSTDIALCIDEISQLMKKLQEIAESSVSTSENSLLPEDFSAEDLYILKTIFLELEKAIDQIKIPNDGSGVTYPGSFMFELLEKADITPNKKTIILDVLDKLIQYLTTNSTSPFQRKGAGLQKFSELIKIVFSKEQLTVSYMEFVKQCYKVHINIEEKKTYNAKNEGWAAKNNTLTSKAGKTVSYWCFNPGFGMKDLADQGVHCIILTSGTLSPMESFASELQIPFPIQLENPHIIKSYQVWIATVSKGPDGVALNSSYQNRNKPEYLGSLGQTILNFARIIPGGLLVFFASYPIMKMCQDHWQASGIWSRICSIKQIFVEPKTKDGFISAMDEFYAKVKDPSLRGACFLAVCRGKVSEGLDFANKNGRGVIITGLPYPPSKDPRVVLKQKYLEEMRYKYKKGLSGANWYKLEASRAVNQAIGRVIRHKDDYGAIILCDERFNDLRFKNELSAWIRPYLQLHNTFGPALRSVIKFFKEIHIMFPDAEITKDRKEPLKIQYEDNVTPNVLIPSMTVEAHAFRLSASKQMVSSQTKDKMLHTRAEKSVDLGDLYKTTEPILKPVLEESKTKIDKSVSLFSNLENVSSTLNFNTVENILPATSTCNSKVSSVSEMAPKRKRIKVITSQERYLSNFLNDEVSKSSTDLFPSQENKASTSSVKNKDSNASQDSAVVKHAKLAKYLKEVKCTLSNEEYANFANAIKDYKKTFDCDTLTATILSLFGQMKCRHHLLFKFSVFLRPEHREEFELIYNDLVQS